MTKCDFCRYSHLKNGKIYCPHSVCVLPRAEIEKILKTLGREGEEKK